MPFERVEHASVVSFLLNFFAEGYGCGGYSCIIISDYLANGRERMSEKEK